MPKLQVTLPDSPDASHELIDDTITIGRLPDNMIRVNDASVSSHHAQLTLVGENYELKDLNSTNGTFVNGERVPFARLKLGDKIRFGQIETAYVAEIAAGDARPMPEVEEVAVKLASASHRPMDFGSFKKKTNVTKDKAGTMILAFAVVSILVFLGAMASIYFVQAP